MGGRAAGRIAAPFRHQPHQTREQFAFGYRSEAFRRSPPKIAEGVCLNNNIYLVALARGNGSSLAKVDELGRLDWLIQFKCY